tara:strand:+ start:138 stop:770 length:633 start_codon:yes stop_codon:yes gene_type:complete
MSSLNVNTIAEYTSGNGVTIDGALIKDNLLASSAGGGLVLLSTLTASDSASLTADNFVDSSTYSQYYISIRNIKCATDNVTFQFKFRQGGGSGSDLTGTYLRAGISLNFDASGSTVFGNQSDSNVGSIAASVGNAADEEVNGYCNFVPAYDGAGINSMEADTMYQMFNDESRYFKCVTGLESNTASTGLSFLASSGNLTSGKIYIYGVKI